MNLIKAAIAATIVLTASFAAEAQQFTVALKSGEKVTYNNADVDSIYFHEPIAEPPTPQAAPKIGDYYYADGTWSTQLDNAKKPVGIVFCVGIASDNRDRAGYYTLKDGVTPMEEFHGYVVALEDATFNGTDNEGVWWSPFNDDPGAGCSNDITDFLGYTNTKAIVARADKEGGLNDKNYPAAYYATTAYETRCPAPEASSGWFLPSAGQFKYIFDRVYFDEDNSGRSCVSGALEALPEGSYMPLYRRGAEYWSSTEKVDSYGNSTWAYYFNFDESSFKPGFVSDYRKNSSMFVRAILAF